MSPELKLIQSLGCAGGDFTECWTLALALQDLIQLLMHILMEINVMLFSSRGSLHCHPGRSRVEDHIKIPALILEGNSTLRNFNTGKKFVLIKPFHWVFEQKYLIFSQKQLPSSLSEASLHRRALIGFTVSCGSCEHKHTKKRKKERYLITLFLPKTNNVS